VCTKRSTLREHHSVSARRHHQTGHRKQQIDHSRYRGGKAGRQQVPNPQPRRGSVITCMAITAGLGLLFLAVIDLSGLAVHPELIWFGLLVIVFGGAVVENAIRFDSMTDHGPPARSADSVGQRLLLR
jgi:hypothetical protein